MEIHKNLPIESVSTNIDTNPKFDRKFGRFKTKIRSALRFVLTGSLVLSMFGDAVIEKKHETFEEMVKRAKTELSLQGITSEQASTYKPIINDQVYKNVFPYGYNNQSFSDIWRNIKEGREKLYGDREDAWLLYLGMPQKYGTFGISDYRPKQGHDKDKYYYKIIGKFEQITHHYYPDYIKSLVHDAETHGSKIPQGDADIMGTYTLSVGQDEKGHYISYWDKWDLDFPIEQDGFIGKPFEIYDRMYYDPDTFEPIGSQEKLPHLEYLTDGRPVRMVRR